MENTYLKAVIVKKLYAIGVPYVKAANFQFY